MHDSDSAELVQATEPDLRSAPRAAVAAPLFASSCIAASPVALGALASPQRAQAVTRLQRGHGNSAVARMLGAPGRGGRRTPRRPCPTDTTVVGKAGARPDVNAALARMIIADASESAEHPAADRSRARRAVTRVARFARGEAPGLPPVRARDRNAGVDTAHEFPLAPSDAAAFTAGDAAARAAAPGPDARAHSPPGTAVAEAQAPLLADNEVDPHDALVLDAVDPDPGQTPADFGAPFDSAGDTHTVAFPTAPVVPEAPGYAPLAAAGAARATAADAPAAAADGAPEPDLLQASSAAATPAATSVEVAAVPATSADAAALSGASVDAATPPADGASAPPPAESAGAEPAPGAGGVAAAPAAPTGPAPEDVLRDLDHAIAGASVPAGAGPAAPAAAEPVATESGGEASPPAAGEAAPQTAPAAERTDEAASGSEAGLVQSVMIRRGGGAPTPAPSDDAAAKESGLTAGSAAREQIELIQRDSDMREQQVAEITDANRQRIGGEFGEVRQGFAAMRTRSSAGIQAFIVGKRAEISGVATGVLAAAQGLLTGAVHTAQAGAERARAGIDSFVAGVSESLQGRVQGIARQITGVLNSISLPDLPGIAQLRAAAGGLVNRAASAVTGGLGMVQGLIGSAVGTGAQIVSSLIASVGNVASGALTQISGAIQRGMQAASSMLSRIADMVLRALSGLMSVTVLPVVNQLEARLGRALAVAQSHAVDAIRSNRDQHLQELGRPDEAGEGTVTPEGANALRAIGQEAVQNNQTIVQTYEQRTSSTLGSISQALIGGAARFAQHLAGIITQAIAAIVSKVGEIVQAFQQIVGAVRSFAQSLIQEAASAVAGAVQFVRSLIEQPAQRLTELASSAWTRLTGFVGGLVRRVLSGDFGLPSLSDVIGSFTPADITAGGPITKPRPGPITLPGLLSGILLAIAVFGALVVYAFPALAVLVVELLALGLTPVVAFLVIGIGAIVALILLLLVLYLLYRLLKSKPKPKDPPPTITHETDFNAPGGAPKTRTDVGVGERVVFTGSASGAWTATAGGPATGSGTTFAWTAPQRAQTPTVTLTVGTESASGSLNVIEPNGIVAVDKQEINFPPGQQGAGMTINFQFQPLTVSFGNAESREVAGPASDVKGYYERHGPLDHDPGPPDFFRIAENNTFADALDTAAQQGLPPESPPGAPPRWDDGSFFWDIPNRFRTITEAGDGKVYTQVIQNFTIEPDGRSTVTKAGEKVERTP